MGGFTSSLEFLYIFIRTLKQKKKQTPNDIEDLLTAAMYMYAHRYYLKYFTDNVFELVA